MQNIMNKTITKLFYATFLLALFCLSPAYPYNPGSVLVIVKDYHDNSAQLGGAYVQMEPGGFSATTADNGTVIFEGVIPYRNYSVSVTKNGYVGGRFGEGRAGFVWVETGQATEVVVPLKKQSSIYGAVTTANGEPVSRAMVVLLQEEYGEGTDLATVALTLTDEGGNYKLLPVAEGDYTIRAVADSYYQVSETIQVAADEEVVLDLMIKRGITFINYKIMEGDTYYGNTVLIIPSKLRLFLFNDFYYKITHMPVDAEIQNPGKSSFTPTLPGKYTITMMVIDHWGVGREVTETIEMTNHLTEAFPSIIPGPSELPLLYNGETYSDSRGTLNVRPGDKVYLRGWGKDFNLGSPEQFNPDAPMFDIYGNKNGDWEQSAFSFNWSLKDESGTDKTLWLNQTTSQNVCFNVPDDAMVGDTYTALLSVSGDNSLAGEPTEVSVVVSDFVGNDTCGDCHKEIFSTFKNTTHSSNGVGCEECHGPGSQHKEDDGKVSISHWPGICGRCHEQFAQWQKSRHSDPLAFGHAEVGIPRLSDCYKCHYTEGFIGAVESGDFSSFDYPMFTHVPEDTPNISCDVCHDPHNRSNNNPYGIRTESAANLCGTCHEKKWQNATYKGKGNEIGNAWHWNDYTQYQGNGNPHTMDKGCVTCHMSNDIEDTDDYGVLKLGGHSLRMRDVGPDRDPGTSDDLMNIDVCKNCHFDIETLDHHGAVSRIKIKLKQLGKLLKENNSGFLPPFQPGKCATCHRGGTLPFINDTADGVLNNAYTNYKLILNDGSFGIHNPGYIERLLDDSIEAVKNR